MAGEEGRTGHNVANRRKKRRLGSQYRREKRNNAAHADDRIGNKVPKTDKRRGETQPIQTKEEETK